MAAATTETSYPCLLAGAVLGGGRYVVVREINRGGAAVVYEAVDREMQMAVAIKAVILDVRTRDAQVTRERVEREIKNAAVITHENVIRLLNVFAEGNCLALVLELVRGCDLLELINNSGGMLTESMARHYFLQLVSGVEYLHQRGVCHRDLKPENCMVDLATNQLKIIDLGLSKHMQSARTLGIGTPDYMAPELVLRPSYSLPQTPALGTVMEEEGGAGVAGGAAAPSPASVAGASGDAFASTTATTRGYDASAADVWSMGATLYLMVCGAYPFEDPSQPRNLAATLRNVSQGKYRPLPRHLSAEVGHLLSRMFDPDPTRRITLREIREASWCQQNQNAAVQA